MSIWKTLRQQKPDKFTNVIILTTSGRIIQAFYNPEDGKFWERLGWVHPISNYKRWCYEKELVEQALGEINI
jgi:hypothetical protein